MTRNEKAIIFFSIGIVLFLIYLIVFSSHGFIDYKNLKSKQRGVTEQIEIIDEKNEKLTSEIKALKSDETYLKHVAKHEHEMAEKEDIIFKLKKRKTKEE